MSDATPLRRKYPRTRHLSKSRSVTSDDKVATPEEVALAFEGQEVVVTEKMDGENTTIYGDGHSHARSLDSRYHESRSIVRELAARLTHELPPNLRICGENLFAEHSISYRSLSAHFQVFSLWVDDVCLSWDETMEWCSLLDLTPVPTIYRGPWLGETLTHERWLAWRANQEGSFGQTSEGFVARRAGAFQLEDFPLRVMKFVRKNHVQTQDSTHWMAKPVVVNGLR